MKKMKRFAILTIAVAMCVTASHAQENNYDFSAVSGGKTLYYKIIDDAVCVTYPRNSGTNYYQGYAKPNGSVIIPDSVLHDGVWYNVTAVDAKAFYYCSGMTSVSIPSTVLAIGDSAFLGCSNLKSTTMGDSLSTIGTGAFRGCSHLKDVVLPSTITMISNYAFFGCSSLIKLGVESMMPPTVIGNTLTADTLVIHCDAMQQYSVTFPWNTRFATVVGFTEDLPVVYDSVSARCSYVWRDGNKYDRSVDSLTFVGAMPWVCDSLYVLSLFVDSTGYMAFDTLVICQSMQPYSYADTVIEQEIVSGDYVFQMLSAEECDSTVYLNLTVHDSEQPQLCMVSVVEGRNVITWIKEGVVKMYNLYREGNTTGQYDLVASIPADSMSVWIDEDSRPVRHSYRYRISSVDSCDIESELSQEHKTMHLTINKGVGTGWNLVWTEYEGADYSTYQIYRGTSDEDMELIDVLSAGGNTTYTDPDVQYDTVFYQIAIVKDEPCTPTKASSVVKSNVATNRENVAIDGVDAAYLGRICVDNGRIIVKGVDNTHVKLFDVMGREVDNVSLERGIFMVMVDGYTVGKVFVNGK